MIYSTPNYRSPHCSNDPNDQTGTRNKGSDDLKQKKKKEKKQEGKKKVREGYERYPSRVGNSVGYDVYSRVRPMEGHFLAR